MSKFYYKTRWEPSPTDLRKQDPEPQRPTPRASGKRLQKRYGFSVERRNWMRASEDWKRAPYAWFLTAKQRDQAMVAFAKQLHGWRAAYYRDPQRIER